MKLSKRIQKATRSLTALASRAVAFFGQAVTGLASILTILSGSNADWNKQAGPRYDNSAVMSIIQYTTGAVESGPRLIVEKPVRGSRGREWSEIDNHQLPLTVANGYRMTQGQLMGGTIISLIVRGDGYWIQDISKTGKVLGYIYVPHWRMTPKNDKDMFGRRAGEHIVTYYEFKDGNGDIIDLPPEWVVHFRWGVDPANPGCGLSPLWAALREIVSDNEAATLMASMLQNGGVLGWAISPKTIGDKAPKLETGAIKKRAELLRRYMTGDLAGTPVPLDMPIEVTQLGYEPSKLVLDKQRQIALERILSQYGIDPMVLGLPSQSKTYSNFAEANEAAVRRMVLRVLGIFAQALTDQSLKRYFGANVQQFSQERVSWDVSEVPALQPDIDALHKRVRDDWLADLVKRKVALEELGYEVSAEDDVYYSAFKADLAPKPDSNPPAKAKPEQKARSVSDMDGAEVLSLLRKAIDKAEALESIGAD